MSSIPSSSTQEVEMIALKAELESTQEELRIAKEKSLDTEERVKRLEELCLGNKDGLFWRSSKEKNVPKNLIRKEIKDKNDGYVEIKLVDTITGKIAEVGALSLIKKEIVVLDGKQKITLRGGVGTIEDLSFTDNSSWIKGRKFRLGARVVESNSMGQVIFKEAVSEAFVVRDKRQKGSDLKKMYETDPEKLGEIRNGVTYTEWEVIVQYGPYFLDNANSNPSRSRDSTTYPQLHQGMQNNSSRASSSQYISACTPENLQDLTRLWPCLPPPLMLILNRNPGTQQ
ncbi:hypothetical protein EZV62_006483 [Acer yangbiense]|uniref:Calmodulin binding protein-like N-terminal domain-containing protein n=1 Tax=Acer yangbiense TaxID=1000413 RepID=A0A5C7I820_9ROSI|nr:hypothetical protein EZV62_006483 [Acer yangbiense]